MTRRIQRHDDSRRPLARIGTAVAYAGAIAATIVLAVLVLLTEFFAGRGKGGPLRFALENRTDAVVEVAPVATLGRIDVDMSPEGVTALLSDGIRPNLLGGYVDARMRVRTLRPGETMRVAMDSMGWFEAVLVREHGGTWREFVDWSYCGDLDRGESNTLADLATLAPADPIFAAFVDEHRDDVQPTIRTYLLAGPLLLLARLSCRTIAAVRRRSLAPWNWRLEVALTFWVMGAAIVIAALAWELAS